MTTSAWVLMLSVWTIIIGSTLYCFAKLLSSNQQLDSEVGQEPDQGTI